jgi:hypothetical protein
MECSLCLGRSAGIALRTFLLAGEHARCSTFGLLIAHVVQESRVIVTNDLALTYELHVIRAHLLHYTALLSDFKKSVEFVRDTRNPAMHDDSITDAERELDKKLLDEECGHLLTEIERLQMNRQMQDDRVQNVTHLVTINLGRVRARISDLDNPGICNGQYRRQ